MSGAAGRWIRARVLGERALRLVVLGLLGWYLTQVLRAPGGRTVDAARSAELPRQLVRWSTVASPAQVHAVLAYPPPLEERDWLTALAGAGTAVGWSGRALVPTAAVLEPLADPAGGADLAVAAPARAHVVLRDALGAFDTVMAASQGGASGVRVYVPSPPAAVEAAVGAVVATAPRRDSLVLKRLLVLGHAGWETKFTTAALEERGWQVEALMALSPKGQGDVWQGPQRSPTSQAPANPSASVAAAAGPGAPAQGDRHAIDAIDTATYAAVLALDTVAYRYTDQLVRYVQQGGGLLLWPEAAQSARLTALAPAVPGGVLPDEGKIPTGEAPRSMLTLAPLEHLKRDALPLEQQHGRTAVAARRTGPGRIVQLGYLNTWRWRLAGLDGADRPALDAHRDWLARLVAQVAYTGRRARAVPAGDAAPLAMLVDQLGSARAPLPSPDLMRVGAWVFGLLVAAVLLEWASRRLRGAA